MRRRELHTGAFVRLGKLRHGHVVASCARVHRRVGVRTGVCCSQSRFCLRIAEIPPKSQRVCPDCNVPARMAAFSSELRISFRIARFSCELPIYSRMTACLLGRRGFSFSCGNFSRTAVCLRDWRVHAGLLGVLYRDIGGGCKAANSANGGAVGLTAGSWRDGELGDGLSAGTTAVSTANFQLARGGGELGFRLGCKSCVRCVKCTVLPSYAAGRDMPFGECAFFICGGTWELKMLPWGLAGFGNARVILPIPEFARFGGRVWEICKVAVRRNFGGLFAGNFFHGAVNNLSVL